MLWVARDSWWCSWPLKRWVWLCLFLVPTLHSFFRNEYHFICQDFLLPISCFILPPFFFSCKACHFGKLHITYNMEIFGNIFSLLSPSTCGSFIISFYFLLLVILQCCKLKKWRKYIPARQVSSNFYTSK